MKRRISHVCDDVDLQYDVVTDVKVLSVDELRSPKGRQPVVVNALNEGMAIYPEKGIVPANILFDKMRSRRMLTGNHASAS